MVEKDGFKLFRTIPPKKTPSKSLVCKIIAGKYGKTAEIYENPYSDDTLPEKNKVGGSLPSYLCRCQLLLAVGEVHARDRHAFCKLEVDGPIGVDVREPSCGCVLDVLLLAVGSLPLHVDHSGEHLLDDVLVSGEDSHHTVLGGDRHGDNGLRGHEELVLTGQGKEQVGRLLDRGGGVDVSRACGVLPARCKVPREDRLGGLDEGGCDSAEHCVVCGGLFEGVVCKGYGVCVCGVGNLNDGCASVNVRLCEGRKCVGSNVLKRWREREESHLDQAWGK